MIKKKAFAKLNLNLHIFPQKNNSGHYLVRFINTQLALCDELLFEPIRHGIKVVCDHKEMPKQEDNLVYKAALLLQGMDPQKRGIKITIKKNIPVRAGLGGGSSDAAVTVNTLSELWNIHMTRGQRVLLADSLGKDVHYLLSGGVAEIGGDGDKVILLPFDVPQLWVVIVVPKETKPSTKWMYSKIDKTKIGRNIHSLAGIKDSMRGKNQDDFLNNIYNDFEAEMSKYFPVILSMKHDLKNAGASATLLCGSGLSMAGFFISEDKAIQTQKLLSNKYKDVIISQLN